MESPLLAVTQDELELAAHQFSFDEIQQQCEARNAHFVDSDFPADASSLNSPHLSGRLPRSALVSEWRRPHQIPGYANPCLFDTRDTGIAVEDVVQGALGDCWFLSVVSALASRPDMLYPLFRYIECCTVLAAPYSGVD